MPTNSKYLKLGLILLIPIVIGLMWRGFVSIFTGGRSTQLQQQTGSVIDDKPSPLVKEGQKEVYAQPNLGTTQYNGDPTTLTIAIPDWFDISTMSGTEQSLKSDNITIKRTVITGIDYHTQLWKLMASGSIDLSLISTDRANDCGQGCALAFDYSQPIDAFVLSPIVEVIRDPYWTMIPYGLDPLVTYHAPQRSVGGSWSSLFNDVLINTSTNKTAGSLPLAIGIGAADRALLRAGKEPYPGYTEILHQMMIQFSNDESLLKQFIQLTDTAQLWSYIRMKKTIETIAEKFPICNETVAACLVRFTISHYGFGYLTDIMRLPPSRQSTITYDQFPTETNYYPLRLRGFVINRRSNATTTAMGRFISAYITDMINTKPPASQIGLISPFASRFETQGYNEQYTNIIRYTDSFHIVRGGRSTSLDRARNGGLMSVIDGNSSIQIYLSQQGIN